MRNRQRRLLSIIALAFVGVAAACCPPPPPIPAGPTDDGNATATCLVGEPCPSELTVTAGGQTTTASFGPGVNDTTLVLRVNPSDAPPFECADYPRTPDTVVVEFYFTGGDASDRNGTLTSTFESPNSEPQLNDYKVCWAAPYQFLTEDAVTLAEPQGVKPGTTDPLYVGVLPNCEQGEDYYVPAPCVSYRFYDSETNLIHVEVQTTGADPWRY